MTQTEYEAAPGTGLHWRFALPGSLAFEVSCRPPVAGAATVAADTPGTGAGAAPGAPGTAPGTVPGAPGTAPGAPGTMPGGTPGIVPARLGVGTSTGVAALVA